jgi:hypothetical protein
MRDFRPLLASLTSPMVALLPLASVAVHQLDAPTLLIGSGPAGETPLRAVGLVLMLFPVFYVLLALAAHAMAWGFLRLGLGSLRRFVLGAGVLAMLAAPLLAGIAHLAGWPGAQRVLPAWGALTLLCLLSALPSAACWWLLAGPGRARLSRHAAARHLETTP